MLVGALSLSLLGLAIGRLRLARLQSPLTPESLAQTVSTFRQSCFLLGPASRPVYAPNERPPRARHETCFLAHGFGIDGCGAVARAPPG